MTEVQFDFIQAAGRFDEPVSAFDDSVDQYRELCDAFGVTEIDKNARARVIAHRLWNSTWGNKGPRDDCGLATKKAVFELVHEETFTCSHATYINDRGFRTDTTECAFQVVKFKKTGDIILFGELHTPHGMGPELRKNRVRSDVAKAYVQITKAYLKRAKKLMRKFKAKMAALSGDWNLNFRFAWVRAWFRKNLGGWRLNWDPDHLPVRGTHGKYIIDGTLLKGLKVRGLIRILKKTRENDHTAYLMHLVSVKQ